MAWVPSTPVTGAAQTGLTSPTYTLSADTAPDSNGKQHAITALGGTQTGVFVHSVSAPFTATFVRPKVFKVLGKANPVTGLISSVPRNTYKFITRKAVLPLAGQPYSVMLITTTVEVPAGSDAVDRPNINAGLSLHIGLLSQQSTGIGDTAGIGVM